jgi:uncharacterized protein (TIGR00369 family)
MPETNISAKDPRYAEKVRDSFKRQGLMQHLGAELSHAGEGAAEIRVKFRPHLSQQHGFFHAGVTGAIADSASGYAAYSLTPPGTNVLTVEYKLNLLAPAHGEELIARGTVIRAGRTLIICRADVFVLRDGAEKICASSLSTIMAMPVKEGGAEG